MFFISNFISIRGYMTNLVVILVDGGWKEGDTHGIILKSICKFSFFSQLFVQQSHSLKPFSTCVLKSVGCRVRWLQFESWLGDQLVSLC